MLREAVKIAFSEEAEAGVGVGGRLASSGARLAHARAAVRQVVKGGDAAAALTAAATAAVEARSAAEGSHAAQLRSAASAWATVAAAQRARASAKAELEQLAWQRGVEGSAAEKAAVPYVTVARAADSAAAAVLEAAAALLPARAATKARAALLREAVRAEAAIVAALAASLPAKLTAARAAVAECAAAAASETPFQDAARSEEKVTAMSAALARLEAEGAAARAAAAAADRGAAASVQRKAARKELRKLKMEKDDLVDEGSWRGEHDEARFAARCAAQQQIIDEAERAVAVMEALGADKCAAECFPEVAAAFGGDPKPEGSARFLPLASLEEVELLRLVTIDRTRQTLMKARNKRPPPPAVFCHVELPLQTPMWSHMVPPAAGGRGATAQPRRRGRVRAAKRHRPEVCDEILWRAGCAALPHRAGHPPQGEEGGGGWFGNHHALLAASQSWLHLTSSSRLPPSRAGSLSLEPSVQAVVEFLT